MDRRRSGCDPGLPQLEPVLAELADMVIAGAEKSVGIGDEGMEEISSSELRRLVRAFRGVDGA